eukprot:1910604-Amphidinium_carterae.1
MTCERQGTKRGLGIMHLTQNHGQGGEVHHLHKIVRLLCPYVLAIIEVQQYWFYRVDNFCGYVAEPTRI